VGGGGSIGPGRVVLEGVRPVQLVLRNGLIWPAAGSTHRAGHSSRAGTGAYRFELAGAM
jgi:hypothetical protein